MGLFDYGLSSAIYKCAAVKITAINILSALTLQIHDSISRFLLDPLQCKFT